MKRTTRKHVIKEIIKKENEEAQKKAQAIESVEVPEVSICPECTEAFLPIHGIPVCNECIEKNKKAKLQKAQEKTFKLNTLNLDEKKSLVKTATARGDFNTADVVRKAYQMKCKEEELSQEIESISRDLERKFKGLAEIIARGFEPSYLSAEELNNIMKINVLMKEMFEVHDNRIFLEDIQLTVKYSF